MHLELAKMLWRGHLSPGDLAIDATCGQGRDTLYLCQLGATVLGLDTQEEAIEKTKALLAQHAKQATLLCASHATFPSLPAPPRLIVYNLGYLPGGNKKFTTQTETTLQSVSAALELVSPDGAVSITCYPGHPEGEQEERALLELVSTLPSQRWLVSHHRCLNRRRAPSILWIRQVLKAC